MNLNWFLSGTVRHASHMRRHVWKILCAQRDLLKPQAIEAVTESLLSLRRAAEGKVDKARLKKEMEQLEVVANKWLKPYPSAALRENIEVLLVAVAVAMGIRTFVAQPFKIPTGSMQPTLYGVTSNPDFQRPFVSWPLKLAPVPDFEVPNRLKRVFLYWFTGVGYDHVVAQADGVMRTAYDKPTRFLLFNLKQTFTVGTQNYTVWFPPDKLLQRAGLVDGRGLTNPRVFRKGEDVIKMKSYSGDHLFVDRMTYNFRRPQRGEIIVFETAGIAGMGREHQGQFYIKRLMGLSGERIRIGDDRHVYADGEQLTAQTPRLEDVYSFSPGRQPADSVYSGHVNGRYFRHATYFLNGQTEFQIPPNEYLVLGDNTMNSYDSRGWGSFSRNNVIGRSFFVYWPFGSQDSRKGRFGVRTW